MTWTNGGDTCATHNSARGAMHTPVSGSVNRYYDSKAFEKYSNIPSIVVEQNTASKDIELGKFDKKNCYYPQRCANSYNANSAKYIPGMRLDNKCVQYPDSACPYGGYAAGFTNYDGKRGGCVYDLQKNSNIPNFAQAVWGVYNDPQSISNAANGFNANLNPSISTNHINTLMTNHCFSDTMKDGCLNGDKNCINYFRGTANNSVCNNWVTHPKTRTYARAQIENYCARYPERKECDCIAAANPRGNKYKDYQMITKRADVGVNPQCWFLPCDKNRANIDTLLPYNYRINDATYCPRTICRQKINIDKSDLTNVNINTIVDCNTPKN